MVNLWTEQRLKLLENGYAPIRNRDKRTFLKEWPQLDITPELITSWDRMHRDQSTGIRIEDGLCAIDIDINDEEAMKEIANTIMDRIPKIGEEGHGAILFRRGKGAKEAWFVRADEEFGRLHSRSWVRPGESIDDGAHRIEIFGGASPRQFGAVYAHTVADDGTVVVEYRYPERSPLDTRKSDLVELTKQELFQIVDIVEEVLQRLGWTLVEKTTKGENDAIRVYDLTDDMQFDLHHGGTVSLQQLRELAAADPEGGLRCSASWLEGPDPHRSPDRCLITVTRTGNLAIWDSASAVTHCEASLKPRDYSVDVNRVMERLQELKDKRRNRVHTGDTLEAATAKLLRSYAYCKNGGASDVVPIYASSMDDAFAFPKLRLEMMPNSRLEPGPQGGRGTRVNPADLWSVSEHRVSVRGMRMRPDKERPLFEEDGDRWVNTYSAPDHALEGGSPAGGIALLAQLLPDEGERHYFTQWLAHKVLHPYIPGPAVLMVARNMGTGRGTLGVLIGKLLGQSYVTTVPFHMFAGKSYQSQYDDWGAETLMAIVTEASEAGDSSRYAAKADTYTHVKSLIEPRATIRKFVSKKQHFKAWSFTSYLISTNDVDALPIPANDRRFAVLSNGDVADPEFFIEINQWMDVDANVAAFHAYLSNYSLEGYSPYEAPPRTEAQMLMAELSRSPIDRYIEEALDSLTGEVFTLDQIADIVQQLAMQDGDMDTGDRNRRRVIKHATAKLVYRVGVPKGTNWQPMIGGKRTAVYAKTSQLAAKWKLHDRLTEEVLKNRASTVGEKIAKILPFKPPET